MRRYKGEWILTDEEVEQNEKQNKQLRSALTRLLKRLPNPVILNAYPDIRLELELARKNAQRVLKKGNGR